MKTYIPSYPPSPTRSNKKIKESNMYMLRQHVEHSFETSDNRTHTLLSYRENRTVQSGR